MGAPLAWAFMWSILVEIERKHCVNLALTVLEIAAPVFALASIGVVWVKLGLEYPTAFVTRLAMTLGSPALIFVALMETEISPAALSQVTLVAVATGAISPWLASEIDRLRKIRNIAAHTHERVSLDSGSIGDQVANLKTPEEAPMQNARIDKRTRFVWAASNVCGTLEVRLRDLLPLKRPLPEATDMRIMTREEHAEIMSNVQNGHVMLDPNVYDFASRDGRKKWASKGS